MAKKQRTKKTTRPAPKRAAAPKRPQARAKTAKPKRVAAKVTGGRSTRPASTTNPVREIAQQIVDLTVNHEEEKAFAFYADNIASAEPGMPPAVGMDALRQKLAGWRSMITDSSWQARNVWVDGNTIIVEWTGRVTFAGTGKQAELNEIAIHEVENGKIVRERFYYDRTALQP